MSFELFQERLARSILVKDLPLGYDKEDILSNLKNAGTVEDIKLGLNEMIVTFSSANEKDLSKMYDGCPIGDYMLKLEDPVSFEVNKGQTPKAEEKPKAPEPSFSGYQDPVPSYQETYKSYEAEKVQEIYEKSKEPEYAKYTEPNKVYENVEVNPQTYPKLEANLNLYSNPKAQEPELVYVEKKEEKVVEPTPVEKKVVETYIEKKPEPVYYPPERKPEVLIEKKAPEFERRQEPSSTPYGGTPGGPVDISKDLLQVLQHTNLPARSGLPDTDVFNLVTKRNYLLIFTIVWGLQLFLRSAF